MGYWGMIAQWHWIGLQFFWEKLEIGNEKFLVLKFLFLSFVFWKGKMMKNLFIFRRSRVRYCNKILRQFVTNSIETRLKSWAQDIFLSRMRDISWNFELRILFASTFNSPFPFLIYFFPKVVYRQGLKHKGESLKNLHPRHDGSEREQVETVFYDRSRWVNLWSVKNKRHLSKLLNSATKIAWKLHGSSYLSYFKTF